jgi:tRNA (cytidine/uridine-2'-O-)-methyltransferase
MSDQKCSIKENIANLNIVLIQPDIPQNTGNIARLCYATGSNLILVRPLGFRLTDAGLQRAGMDYWKALNPTVLVDLDEYKDWVKGRNVYYLSAHGAKNYAQVSFKPGDVLVFGSESSGLPEEIFKHPANQEKLISLPMLESARCINVSSSASAVVYEALRQIYNW